MRSKGNNRTLIVLLAFYLAGIISRTGAGEFPFYSFSLFIFCTAVMYWASSIRSRIIDDRQRHLLIAIAGMILLLHTLQILKYLFATSPVQLRYLWYMYYIPLILAPLFSIWVAVGVGRSPDEHPNVKYLLLLIPALILIVLLMTNDLHQLMFVIDMTAPKPDRDYTRGILYYITAVWMYGMLVASLAVAVRRCTVAYPRKKAKIAFFIILGGLALLLLFYGSTSGGRRIFGVELLTFQMIWHMIFVLFWEVCITIGLIPSNTHYDDIFTNASIRAQILDREKHSVYKANDPGRIPDEIAGGGGDFSVFVKDDTKYFTKKISGGYVCWEEDIGAILEMNRALWESAVSLREENTLLARESELKAEHARIETFNRLYDEIGAETKEQISEIQDILTALRSSEKEDIGHGIKRIAILTAYIKRCANLMLIRNDAKTIRTSDLMLSVKESLEYAALFGITSDARCDDDKAYDANDIISAYKIFELVFENGIGIVSAVMVRVGCEEEGFVMIIEVSAGALISDIVWGGYREYINQNISRSTSYRYLITDDEAKTFRIKVRFDASADPGEVAV